MPTDSTRRDLLRNDIMLVTTRADVACFDSLSGPRVKHIAIGAPGDFSTWFQSAPSLVTLTPMLAPWRTTPSILFSGIDHISAWVRLSTWPLASLPARRSKSL